MGGNALYVYAAAVYVELTRKEELSGQPRNDRETKSAAENSRKTRRSLRSILALLTGNLRKELVVHQF